MTSAPQRDNGALRRWLTGIALAALLAAGAWCWQHYMESYRYPRDEVSKAAQENPMLAATRLLRQHGHRVDTVASMSMLALDTLPDGILLVGANQGQLTPPQARRLLQWVRRGNTLITTAKFGRPARKTDTPAVDPDPLAGRLKLTADIDKALNRLCNPDDQSAAPVRDKKPSWSRIECYTAPGRNYALTLDTERVSLQTGAAAPVPLSADRDGHAVAVYAEGRGRLVVMAINFFDNRRLPRYDHADLLLELGALAAPGSRVQIVQRLDILPWYRALWQQFDLAIVSLALGLALLLWRAVLRFGPLLPAPQPRRRALLEHINASGRWLWQAPGGRDTLLAAARLATTDLMQRRAPDVLRLAPEAQAQHLAGPCRLAADDIRRALHDDAARQAPDFARQISTLQTLREYYAQQQR